LPSHTGAVYPPATPFARLPWNSQPARYDVADCGEGFYFCPGTVSAWVLLSTDIALEDYFLPDYDACEWEPQHYPMLWDDLGFIFYPYSDDYCTAAELTPVVLLVEELADGSYPQCLQEALIDACTQKSIEYATGIYLAYDYAYSGSPVFGQFCQGQVKFLGAYPYHSNGGRRVNA